MNLFFRYIFVHLDHGIVMIFNCSKNRGFLIHVGMESVHNEEKGT